MAAGNAKSQASGASPGPQHGGQGSPQGLAPISFYALLQLAEDASLEELRQAFRRQSKRLHPDTTSLPATVAQDSFRQLRQAYVTLLDPERRRVYDASLAAARARAGQGLRTSPAAPGSFSVGAGPAGAGGAGGPGISPTQNGGAAPLGGPAGPVRSPGNGPGAASPKGNGSQGDGDLGAKGLDASGLGVGGGLPKPDSVRRTLSGGEWFALLLLGVALVLCLVLGVGLAWLRGTELVREPSWWPEQQALVPSQSDASQPDASQPAASQPDAFSPGPSQATQPLLTPLALLDPSLQASALQRPALP